MKKRPVVLLVDPALSQVESTVHNAFFRMINDANERTGAQLEMRLWLPALGNQPRFSTLTTELDSSHEKIVGCVSLGSYAHVTDWTAHPWFPEFAALLDFLRQHHLPFFGICFAHQFLARSAGFDVTWQEDPKIAGARHTESRLRQVRVQSFRFRLLLARFTTSEWRRRSPDVQSYLNALRHLGHAHSVTEEQWLENPKDVQSWNIRRILDEHCLHAFHAYARHAQKAVPLRISNLGKKDCVVAGSAPGQPIDALVHSRLPWFTVQTHPEAPMTESSQMLLRNFLILCGTSQMGPFC